MMSFDPINGHSVSSRKEKKEEEKPEQPTIFKYVTPEPPHPHAQFSSRSPSSPRVRVLKRLDEVLKNRL
jgi:hypothetical protein